jgi:cellulose synthase/poly-beta-1,6-N-acetylglucosamine synthase-like glycosyltransferase
VTEDADLSVRLARAGFRIADLPLHTAEDAPKTLGVWVRQRSRWMKGFMQTCVTHTHEPVRTAQQLGAMRALAVTTLTFGTVFSALGFPFFVVLIAVGFADGTLLNPRSRLEAAGSIVSLALCGSGLAAMLPPAVIGVRRRRLWGLLPWVPLLPLYYALVSLAAWCGLWELARSPSHWHKTDHHEALDHPPATAAAAVPARPARAAYRG